MGREKVSKMYVDLIKKQKLVSEINAYITGSMDEGLFIITGKLNEGKSFADLDKEIWKIIAHYKTTLISKKELEQIKIKLRTARAFQDQGLLEQVGGIESLCELINQVPNLVYLEEYIQLMQDKFLRRLLIKLGYKTINSGYVTNIPLENIFLELEKQYPVIFYWTQDGTFE